MAQVDQSVLDWVVRHRSPALTDVFMFVTTAGNTAVMTSLAVVLVAGLWIRRRRADALAAAAAMALAWIVMNGVKYATARTRPPKPERIIDIASYSFPSGHALISAAFVTVVFVVVSGSGARRATVLLSGVFLGIVTVAVGVSRIYLAAHWFTDVVAGWALGVACAVLAMTVVRRRIAERLFLSDRAGR
ncbi:phosphatase PAP2 family protein [Actinomycetes bacterium M1A6_2h]